MVRRARACLTVATVRQRTPALPDRRSLSGPRRPNRRRACRACRASLVSQFYQLLGWDSPTHRVLDVLDTDRFIALARRREAVSELELASAHVRMLTADVRLRKLFSRSASLDLPAAHPTCWRSVATSCGMRAQLPEGPISSFSCTDWPSRMAREPQIVRASLTFSSRSLSWSRPCSP